MCRKPFLAALWFVCACLGSTAGAEASDKNWGAGLLYGYHYGQPLGHAVSLGVILGDAATSGGGGSGPSYEPWPVFPGGGGRGILLQGEASQRAFKVSAGFAEASMLYLPPASFGWAVKATYLAPHGADPQFRSTSYVGGEVDIAYWVKGSIGIFQGRGGGGDLLFTWSIGIGF
jgi:hypothetical protein